MDSPSYALSEQGRRLAGRSNLGQFLVVVEWYETPAAMRAALLETASLNAAAGAASRHREISELLEVWVTLALAEGLAVRVN